MAEIRIQVILNKGKSGIPLQKLARISIELQRFLDLLGSDIKIESGYGWLGTGFRDGSVRFTATKIDPVEEKKAKEFKESFRNIATRKPDARVSPSTIRQYCKIAEPIAVDEVVGFGLPPANELDKIDEEWHELSKREALLIATEVQTAVRSHGGVQGIVHSIFFRASPPHFQLRELSTGELIKCVYNSQSQYNQITAVLNKRDAVVHVYGLSITDIVNRKIDELRVERVELAESFEKKDFDRFVGCAPDMLGGQSLQDFIDQVRGRGE